MAEVDICTRHANLGFPFYAMEVEGKEVALPQATRLQNSQPQFQSVGMLPATKTGSWFQVAKHF